MGRAWRRGFLGVAHAPFNLIGREARSRPENMTLNGVTLEKLQDRTSLMKSLDRFRRDADQRGQMDSLDVYTQQAMGILTTSRLIDALDLSKEDPRIVARYGQSNEAFQRDGAPTDGRKLLPRATTCRSRGEICFIELQSLGLAWFGWHELPEVS